MSEAVPFVDLRAQQLRIRADVDRRIAAVLDHGQYIMGPEVAELEARLAARCGARHVVSCASGTDALLMALMAAGVGPGDAVVVPTFTFAATAEVVALVGAVPVFADVLPDTFNLDPAAIAPAVEAARGAGLNPVAVVPVDLFGQLADYPSIAAVAASHALWVLADAAQSLGGRCGDGEAGSFGRMAGTSFFPAKPLGCYGDGGAIFTDDDDLAVLLRSIRVHGKGTDKYDNARIGTNGRLDTLQAAVLLAKLEVFDAELAARREIAARYTDLLAGLAGVTTPVVAPGQTSAWAQYTITIDEGRDRVADVAREAGIPTVVYYPRPLHRQSAYAGYPVAGGGLPVAERLSETVLSLPFHPYLQPDVQERVVGAVADAVVKIGA